MRLKEIKPGMVIHCKTKEEAEKLIELTHSREFFLERYSSKNEICYRMKNGAISGFGTMRHYVANGDEVVEFSDLIEPEMSSEEVLKTYVEMCRMCCGQCPFKTIVKDGNCEEFIINNTQKAIEIISEWKSDHEKKEPEVEWVYRVFGAENFGEKFFDTEEEAIERCEELAKSQKTKKYARYERVCRVKE